MPRNDPHGYLTKRAPKPATQGFQGENAGGVGTFGLLNNGDAYQVPTDLKGTMGKAVAGGDASSEAKRLIAKSTGMQVEGGPSAGAYTEEK